MKIIVTGSGGFIGSYLVPYLLKNGHEITEVSRKRGFDICNYSSLNQIKEADVIIHLAAKTFVPESFENPYDFYDINFKSTLNALELSRKLNAKFILMSSYAYGEPEYVPIDENHPLNPHNPYSQSKLISEELSQSYSRDFGVDVIAFRAFNIYGFGQSNQFLIPYIFNQIQSKKVVLKDSRPKRDYIHVLDVVSAINQAVMSNLKGFNVFNLGTGVSHSVEELIEVFKVNIPFEFEVQFTNEFRKNEVLNTVSNTSKLEKQMQWKPQITLQEGIKMFISEN